jgi:mannose/fructose/N-acetylgalactosamine-specific phosphotransferase system component IIC
MSVAFALLAHQGGWDEFLLVAVPIVVIVGLLAVVKRRVDSAARTRTDAPDRAPDTHPPA